MSATLTIEWDEPVRLPPSLTKNTAADRKPTGVLDGVHFECAPRMLWRAIFESIGLTRLIAAQKRGPIGSTRRVFRLCAVYFEGKNPPCVSDGGFYWVRE